MSEFVSELKAAWIGNRRRKFYQTTRGIMTPEERRALEDEFNRKMAERDRQVAEKALKEGLGSKFFRDIIEEAREEAWDELAGYVASKDGGQSEGEFLKGQNPYRKCRYECCDLITE